MSQVTPSIPRQCVAFLGSKRIAAGTAADVVAELSANLPREDLPQVLIFDCDDSRLLELDLRLTPAELQAQFAAAEPPPPAEPQERSDAPRKRGRPKLGVVSKEVTLLPRHWEWLAAQPGGASVALRKLVEQQRKAGAEKERVRLRQEACYRFMHAMAGDRPNFEEATRALYAREETLFQREIAAWPEDIRAHATALAADVFGHGPG